MNCGKAVEEEIYSSGMENKLKKYISTGALSLGMNPKIKNIDCLITYLKIIKHFQKKINITSIKDPFNIIDKHFLDSLSCTGFVSRIIEECGQKKKTKMIDVGSGAGFPGIPINIFFPEERMTLLEARKNKKSFLEEAVARLGLKNTIVIQNRAENLGKMEDHREKYDIVLSRAVAPLGILCEYCLPLCKIQGAMIAFKGSSYYEELLMNYKVIKKLGGFLESINLIKIPHTKHIRSILVIRKTNPTPEGFPRRNGIPQKRPLCF